MPAIDGYLRRPAAGAWPASRVSVARWQIATWVDARGWRLTRIFEDAPARPSVRSRPELERVLSRVESGESDGLVIVRLNQIADSLSEALTVLERIEAAGAVFASLGDGIDLELPEGRHMFALLLSLWGW